MQPDYLFGIGGIEKSLAYSVAYWWQRIADSLSEHTGECERTMMYFTRKLIHWSLVLMLACSSGGCATVVSGRKHQVTVNNSGGPTFFSVLDEKGNVVHSGLTPQQVTLKSSSGPFRPAKYSVVYAGQEGAFRDEVRTKVNWWTAGNIVIGGVPGLVIDAATGAMWKFDSEVQGQVPAAMTVADYQHGQAIVAGRETSFAGDQSNHQAGNIQQASFGDKSSQPQHRQARPVMSQPMPAHNAAK